MKMKKTKFIFFNLDKIYEMLKISVYCLKQRFQ